ncbi:MAG: hypothetical protein IJ161_10240 [Bacteroidales bacterium]|nr:hypothetical protein [Bacteroidales bacterium]
MAKKIDPFEKFRTATLSSGNALSGALHGAADESRTASSPLPSRKESKNANRKMVSFHIDQEVFRKLGQLKFEMGTKYDDLYNEAITDLLIKYGKL